MQVHNVVAIVLPPAMAFSYMLYEVFLADKISPPALDRRRDRPPVPLAPLPWKTL